VVEWVDVLPIPNCTLPLVNWESPNVTGKFVYIEFPIYVTPVFLKPYSDKIQNVYERGAVAVFTYASTNRRELGYNTLGILYSDFPITVSIIPYDSSFEILGLGAEANLTFIDWDTNTWVAVTQGPGYIIYVALLFIMDFTNVVLSTYILWLKFRFKPVLSVAFISLCLESVSNTIRVIQAIIYPWYNVYLIPAVDITLTLPMCLTLITGLLVIFYWFDLTSDPFFHKRGKFLGMMKRPVIIIATILVLFEITLDLLRNLVTFDVVEAVLLSYTIIHGIIAVFYFVAAWKMLDFGKFSETKKFLRVITERIICIGLAAILSLICISLILTPATFTPIGFVTVWFIMLFSFSLQSFLLITIFVSVNSSPKPATAKSPNSDQEIEAGPEY